MGFYRRCDGLNTVQRRISVIMTKRKPIRRGAFGRGLAVSLAGARAGGALAFDGALRRLRGDDGDGAEVLAREAQRFATRLGELKGTYVKIGQMLALLGEHFLPPEVTRALHGLAAGTEPLAWSDIEPVVADALGSRMQELDIEPQAIAAASLAQVHRARVKKTGQILALKVQYPDLRDVIDDDFDAAIRMLRLTRWLPAGREVDRWLETMRTELHREVDYPRELAMAGRFSKALADLEHCTIAGMQPLIPNYHRRWCADNVLAMDFVEGLPVTNVAVLALPQAVRNDLGRTMLDLFFKEVFDWSLMQADPNFGNYLIAEDGLSLTLLDFGSVMTLAPAFRQALADAIVAALAQNQAALVDALIRLGCLRKNSGAQARETFVQFIEHVIEPLQPPARLPKAYLNADGDYQWGASQLMTRAGKRAAGSATSRQFTLPSEDFALLVRKLTGVFTFIAVLDAQFNGWPLLAPYLNRQNTGAEDLVGATNDG